MADDSEKSPLERAADIMGRTPAEVAALDRVFTGLREVAVARQMLLLSMYEAAGAFRNFGDAWRASEERITADEAHELAGHPDLAEVNVRLDALYEQPA